MDMGSELHVNARVGMGNLSPQDVQVQLFHGLVDSFGDIPQPQTVAMHTNGAKLEGNTWLFDGTIPCGSS